MSQQLFPGSRRRLAIAWLGVVACNLAAQDGGGGRTGDNDLMSSAVELNGPNRRLYGLDTTVNDPDPSRARGTPTNGSILDALNLPDAHRNYYHYLGTDGTDTDDWGTLTLINRGEGVAGDWGDVTRPCIQPEYDPSPPNRFGIGDMSLGDENTQIFGGETPDHTSHENGLDMDIRFLRTDDAESPLDLESPQVAFYDVGATADLMGCFLYYTNVERLIVDTVYANIDFGGDTRIVHDVTHRDHFHIRIVDPDGLAN
jgi:hypothetical protein